MLAMLCSPVIPIGVGYTNVVHDDHDDGISNADDDLEDGAEVSTLICCLYKSVGLS